MTARNCGVIAPGNHWILDSLRGAPPPGEAMGAAAPDSLEDSLKHPAGRLGALFVFRIVHMGQGKCDALVDKLIPADLASGGLGVDLRQNLRGYPHGDHFLLRLPG